MKIKAVRKDIGDYVKYDPEAGEFFWIVTVANCATEGSAIKQATRITLEGERYEKNRVAWFLHYGVDPGDMLVDHRNCDRSDNRIENLRLATHSQNSCNIGLKSNNSSGVKGVSRTNSGKWVVHVKKDGVKKNFGTFETLEEAALAAESARENSHKSFARHL